MAKYRKKPVVIEAVQITDEWFDGDHPNPLHPTGIMFHPSSRTVSIPPATAQVGDFIITDDRGERCLCRRDIFDKTYEPA